MNINENNENFRKNPFFATTVKWWIFSYYTKGKTWQQVWNIGNVLVKTVIFAKFRKSISFRDSFRENMCKKGANAPGSLKNCRFCMTYYNFRDKGMIYIFFAKNGNVLKVLAKVFAKKPNVATRCTPCRRSWMPPSALSWGPPHPLPLE